VSKKNSRKSTVSRVESERESERERNKLRSEEHISILVMMHGFGSPVASAPSSPVPNATNSSSAASAAAASPAPFNGGATGDNAAASPLPFAGAGHQNRPQPRSLASISEAAQKLEAAVAGPGSGAANVGAKTAPAAPAAAASTPAKAAKGKKKKKAAAAAAAAASASIELDIGGAGGARGNHQLPMFLSKTYHMIDRCDPTIATWSTSGDSFVIKNIDVFSSNILPQYFKHSNFSSFARQLNFYGFRKLKSDPICLTDVSPGDESTAYISFYHCNFQKDRPELLQSIKRATKSEQQTKLENEGLRKEVAELKEMLIKMQRDSDKKIADVIFDMNRRFASLTADYELLLASVRYGQHPRAAAAVAAAASSSGSATISPPLPPTDADGVAASMTGTGTAAAGTTAMKSLSQVVGMHLQRNSAAPTPTNDEKRSADEMDGQGLSEATQLASSSKKVKVDTAP